MTTTSTPAKPARKTPAQIAQQRLDVANRRVTELKDKLDANAKEKTDLSKALFDAKADRDYKAANPALPKQPNATTNVPATMTVAGAS